MTNQRLFKILDIFSYILLLINVFSIPLILDKNLVDLYIIPKEYLFIGLILLNLLAFAIKVVISKRLLYRRSILDVAILGLLALFLLSSFFSINIYDSFLGRGDYFILHFIFFLSMAIFYFVLVNYVNRFNLWQGVLDVLLLTGGLTAILFCLKIVFHYDLLSSWFGIVAWNPIDKINSSFGLWSVVIFILSAGQLIKRDLSLGRSLANFFIAIISLTAVVLLGFKALWWLLLIGLILLLLLGVNFLKEARTGWLSVLFATLIFTVILVTFGTPKQLASVVPAEVALGNRPSWNIAGSVILSSVKNFLLGSGPGTFNVDFSQFRTENFNYDNNAWNLRFGQPFSSLQAFVAESGLLFTVLLIFIILYVLGHVFQVCYHSRSHGMMASLGTGFNHRDSVRFEVFLSAVAWMVL